MWMQLSSLRVRVLHDGHDTDKPSCTAARIKSVATTTRRCSVERALASSAFCSFSLAAALAARCSSSACCATATRPQAFRYASRAAASWFTTSKTRSTSKSPSGQPESESGWW